MTYFGPQSVLVRGSGDGSDSHRILYVKIWLACFEGSLNFVEERILCSGRRKRNALSRDVSRGVSTENLRTRYRKVKKEGMRFFDSRDEWVQKGDGNVESFVGLLQLFSDKMTTTTKSTTLADSGVHSTLWNVLARRKWWMGHRYTLVRFLAVYCLDEKLEGEERRDGEEMAVYGFYIFCNGVIGEWCTCSCRICADGAKHECTSRIWEGSNRTWAVMRPKIGSCENQRRGWVELDTVTCIGLL